MTKVRQRSVVTREGWYYLFILGFVVLGSLLRNIQLMVGLSTILATGMIVNWRWSKAMLRGIIIRRLPVESLWAGQLSKFRCEIENPRSRLSAFSLLVTQRFKIKKLGGEPLPPEPWYRRWLAAILGPNMQHFHLVDAVHPGQRVVADMTVVFGQRGEYESSGLGVASHFPLGLVRRQWEDGQTSELIVGPAIGTLSQNWVEQMLGLGWQDSRSGQIARSGEEFFSLRPYTSGDSQRWIHWRASARHNAVLVRQFQRSQSKAFTLFVDLWAADEYTGESLAVGEKMLRVLATISAAVRAGHLDSVRLTLVGETETSIEFPASEADWNRWHRELAIAQPHRDISRLRSVWRRMADESGAKSVGQPRPIIWLSPVGIDQYVKVLQASSQNEESRSSRGPQSQLNDPNNAAHSTSDSPDLLSEFWRAQASIRSWLTPGEGWLSSWYLEPTVGEEDRDMVRDGFGSQRRNDDTRDSGKNRRLESQRQTVESQR
ncbi:MAG: DUF58 domain-containing protein [Planctomycetaceae bacterium]|nr:DUF58 domain-containing protein [Planctomycetaceae bacterium]